MSIVLGLVGFLAVFLAPYYIVRIPYVYIMKNTCDKVPAMLMDKKLPDTKKNQAAYVWIYSPLKAKSFGMLWVYRASKPLLFILAIIKFISSENGSNNAVVVFCEERGFSKANLLGKKEIIDQKLLAQNKDNTSSSSKSSKTSTNFDDADFNDQRPVAKKYQNGDFM